MDKFFRDAIDIIFSKMSPQKIISLMSDCNGNSFISGLLSEFCINMKTHYPFISSDEVGCIKLFLEKYFDNDECKIFKLLSDFAKETMTEQRGTPLLKFDEILRFRNTSHYVGPEIFVSAFLADKDSVYNNCNRKFDYQAFIDTDNTRLHNMLKKGVSENHFHIKGSTPAFMLSWVCLMNNIVNRRKTFEEADFENNPLGFNSEGVTQGGFWYSLIVKACYIRAFLFAKLNDIPFSCENDFLEGDTLICESMVGSLQEEIEACKKMNASTLDYTIPIAAIDNEEYRIFTGERNFLYLMFRAIYEKDSRIVGFADLFYLYLLIAVKFRGELIQSNKRVGFANFEDYQDRKGIFIKGYSAFEHALISFALNSNLKSAHIKSIEARFVPKMTCEKIQEQINSFDSMVNKKPRFKKRLFYVAHFPKTTDTLQELPDVSCRHQDYRERLKCQALAIARLREEQSSAAYRLFGIDACGNEIGCRPEVFAQAFRFLKSHQVSIKKSYNKLSELPPPLKITFHAGEDFLDVADGLRYIDEAIRFAGMSRGDRIGHGLALGIEPKSWYRLKRNRVILSRQDLLDNAAWLMGKLIKYGYSHMPIFQELNNIYSENMLRIYQKNLMFQERDTYIDLACYLAAYSLRGDNPKLYFDCNNTEKYTKNLNSAAELTEFNYFLYDKNMPEDSLLNNTRMHNIRAYKLMHHYHYNPEVKKDGAEIVELNISDEYIGAVTLVQEKMRFEIADLGIGIECNPSSNILIGTFEKYDSHPILKFNDALLSDSDNNARMFISINTDDLGIFDTSLENEYALVACALQKAKDGSGKKLYKPDDIYRYLDNIREMSIEQSFNR